MSRGGSINIARLRAQRQEAERLRAEKRQRLESNSELLVQQATYEMDCKASCNSIRAYMVGHALDVLTGPTTELQSQVYAELQRQGAAQLPLPNRYDEAYSVLHAANVSRAAEQAISLPAALVERPVFVTQETVVIQQQVADLLAAHYDARQAEQLSERLTAAVMRTQNAYDTACVVAGAHATAPLETVLDTVQQLADGIPPVMQERIEAWFGEAKVAVAAEMQAASASVVLGAAKVALDLTGFVLDTVDLAAGKIVAAQADDPSKSITVEVNAEITELKYDLNGYKGRTCDKVERRFLDNLAEVIGVDIPATARVSRPKAESFEARPAQRLPGIGSPTADATRPGSTKERS